MLIFRKILRTYLMNGPFLESKICGIKNKSFFKKKSNFNPLMPGGNKKVTHTLSNLQLLAAGLFKYVWPFCYDQALKG